MSEASHPDVTEPRQPPASAIPPSVSTPPPADQLTAEEQMIAFEKALKESDWGHQPC